MGQLLSAPFEKDELNEEKEEDGWTVVAEGPLEENGQQTQKQIQLPTEETTVRWLQRHEFIQLDPTYTHHPIPPEVLRESIALWKKEDEQFVPKSDAVSDDEDTPEEDGNLSASPGLPTEDDEGWRSVVLSWRAKPDHFKAELEVMKERYAEIEARLAAQAAATEALAAEVRLLRAPPPPPPAPRPREDSLMRLLVAQIDQTELPPEQKAAGTAMYLKKFAKNPKGLEKLLRLHPYLVAALPVNPKRAFARMAIWESELFEKVDEDVVPNLRLQKRHAVTSLSSEEDIRADIKLTQVVLAKRRLAAINEEQRAAAAGVMQRVLTELHTQLARRRPVNKL